MSTEIGPFARAEIAERKVDELKNLLKRIDEALSNFGVTHIQRPDIFRIREIIREAE